MSERPEPRTAQAELDALQSLVASEGWSIVRDHHDQAWGSRAYEHKIGKAIESADPSESRAVRDTFLGVRAEHAWVYHRIEALKKALTAQPEPADRFAHLRRGPVSA